MIPDWYHLGAASIVSSVITLHVFGVIAALGLALAVMRLFSRNKIFPGQFNVFKYCAKQAFSDVFTFMERNYRRAAVWMAKINMASFLTNLFKPQAAQDAD
jgi:hypothetical protein